MLAVCTKEKRSTSYFTKALTSFVITANRLTLNREYSRYEIYPAMTSGINMPFRGIYDVFLLTDLSLNVLLLVRLAPCFLRSGKISP